MSGTSAGLVIAFDTNTQNLDAGLRRVQQSLQQVDTQAQATGRTLDATMSKVQASTAGFATSLQGVAAALQSSGLVGASSPLITGLEAIGGAVGRIQGAMATLGGLATGPVGALVVAATTAVTVFQNWERITAALNVAFGASTAGMESARRATDAYTAAMDGITRATETAIEAQQRLARQAAETLRSATASNIAAMQAELTAQQSIMGRLQSIRQQADLNESIGGGAINPNSAAGRRLRQWEEARDRAEQIARDIQAARDRLEGALPQVLRGNAQYGPDAPAGAFRTGGRGGGTTVDAGLQAASEAVRQQQRDLEALEAQYQRTADQTRNMLDPTARYRDLIEDVRAAQAANFLTTDEATAAIARYEGEIRRASGAIEDSLATMVGKSATSAFQSLAKDLQSVATGAMSAGEAMLRFAQNFLSSVAQMMAQAAAVSMLRSVFGAFGWTDMAAAVGSGGRRMAGGAVSPGVRYMVGEAGPEMFVPRVAGTIVPNSGLGGISVVVNNNAPGVNVRPTMVDEQTLAIAVELSRQQVAADYRDSMRFGTGPYSEPLSRGFNVRRRT